MALNVFPSIANFVTNFVQKKVWTEANIPSYFIVSMYFTTLHTAILAVFFRTAVL